MGKAQKIKEERKVERKLYRERTIARKKVIKRGVFGLFLLIFFVGGLLWAMSLFDQNSASQEVANKEEKKDVIRKYDQYPEMTIDQNKIYLAKFVTTAGDFEVELFAKEAPKTVNNFVFLTEAGFYDGLNFHRVIKDFMIQGGDPNGDGSGGPGYQFEDEINDRKLVRGVLAMANSGENTNGSQFFIVTKEATDWLDGKHTAFGQVTTGLETVMNIEKAAVDENDKPIDEIKIIKLTIEER